MRVVLLFPPSFDPTAPYLALPVLEGALLDAEPGWHVHSVDLNIAVFNHLTTAHYVSRAGQTLSDPATDRSVDDILYGELGRLLGTRDAAHRAAQVVRDPARFQDAAAYRAADAAIMAAFRVISRTIAPTTVSPHGLDAAWTAGEAAADIFSQAHMAGLPALNFLMGALITVLDDHRPDVVGISVTAQSQLLYGVAVAEMADRVRPDAVILMGGAYLSRLALYIPSVLSGLGLQRHVDAVVCGPGEQPLLAACSAIAKGRWDQARIPGLLRTGSDRAVALAAAEGTLGGPSWRSVDWTQYLAPTPIPPVRLSRGCSWARCAYCGQWASSGRYCRLGPEQAVRRVIETARTCGTRCVQLVDDSLDPALLRDLAAGLGTADICWYGNTRPEGIDRELARSLRRSGCVRLSLGLETTDRQVSGRMGRGIDVEQALAVLGDLRAGGPDIELYSIFGFPGQTAAGAEQAAQELVRLCARLDSHGFSIKACPFRLDPGSSVWLDPDAHGIDFSPPVNWDITDTAYHARSGMSREETVQLTDDIQKLLDRRFRKPYPVDGRLGLPYVAGMTVESGTDREPDAAAITDCSRPRLHRWSRLVARAGVQALIGGSSSTILRVTEQTAELLVQLDGRSTVLDITRTLSQSAGVDLSTARVAVLRVLTGIDRHGFLDLGEGGRL